MHSLNLIIIKYVIYYQIFAVISLKLKSIRQIIIIQQMIYLIKNRLIIYLILQITLNPLEEAVSFSTNQLGYIFLVNIPKIHISLFINLDHRLSGLIVQRELNNFLKCATKWSKFLIIY
jgi:hypothetical protein